MSFVVSEMLDGLFSLVVKGETINWFPPLPPLPVILTLLSVAEPPNELIPFRLESTLNGMPEMGTFPMEVLATTFAVPSRPKLTDEVSVTEAKNWSKAPLFREVNG